MIYQVIPARQEAIQTFEHWQQHLAENCGTFHVEPPALPGCAFLGSISRLSGAAGVMEGARISTNSSRMHRSERDIRGDDKDFYYLVMQLQGAATVRHSERESMLGCGDLVLLDIARPCEFQVKGFSDQLSLILPRPTVQAFGGERRLLLNQPLKGQAALGRMLGSMLVELSTGPAYALEECYAVRESIIALLWPGFSERPASVLEVGDELMLQRAQEYIVQHLSDEALSPELVAKALGTSIRSLYRRFAQQGLSISRYILEQRLERSARLIRGGRGKISVIALDLGFRDFSNFSRTFKQRFGLSPLDYRRANS